MKKIIICLVAIFMNLYTNHAYSDYTINPIGNNEATTLKNAWGSSETQGAKINIDTQNGIFTKRDTEWDGNTINNIDITAAVNIYRNGAEFCNMNIQYAPSATVWKAWVYKDTCRTICKKNYYGARCEQTQMNSCDDEDFTGLFNFANTKQTGLSTNMNIMTLSIDKWSIHPLTVLDRKEHAIQVGDIVIGISSGATGVDLAYYHGTKQWLCAPGYEGENGNCRRSPNCQSLCPTGQGYPSINNKTCEPCGDGTKRSGVDSDGVCHECNKGEIFDTNKRNCVKTRTITKEKMRNCAKEHHNLTDVINCIKDWAQQL